ncbi:MAG: MBL fold metallo-hydrolase [Vicinamibacterales bacterium]|nr:MBL fold metallo-hydrolase [Vicinamibacterales bacterium]
MRIILALLLATGLAAAVPVAAQTATKTLQIYYIDTEGGQSTLFVSPSGETLMVDAGNPGGRDTDRIMLAVADAGVKQIDHLVLTHYHGDHAGGLAELAKRIPIKHFYDHGPSVEARGREEFQAMYQQLYANVPHTVSKPGDKIAIAGLDVTVVSSAGQVLKTNLPGAGRPNPACSTFVPKDLSAVFDPDNAQSVGFVMAYGRFRTIDLGDLTWSQEGELMCPANRLGTVDLYLVSHHGINQSNSAALVHGVQPRVAIMNNGTRKGGAVETFQTLEASPGLEDLWQLHWSYNVTVEHNAAGAFIANIDDNQTIADVLTAPPPPPRGAGAPGGRGGGGGAGGRGNPAAAHTPAYWIKVTAQPNGTFTVTNTRNGFSKTYKSKG